jgi:serine/threonine protein kinase
MNSTRSFDADRYRRLRDLVERAAERPAGEWGAWLAGACPEDAELRTEALRLLAQGQAARAEHFLEPTMMSDTPGSDSETELYVSPGPEAEPGTPDPTRVGKYQIVRRFSQAGGQGAAYLAFDPELDRHVVLKRYHDGGDVSGLTEEGRALARVDNPYVARCHGIERIADEAYLVVEYVPGRNLAEVRRDGPLDPAWIVRILADLAQGVAAVHDRGLIHRDIKPANVILHDDGKPRLVDFGLATHLASRRLRGLSGSPGYMAPEQARTESDRIDYRTDVYGLGGVLYHLLLGRAPHTGATRNEILECAKKGDVTAPRVIDPAVPGWLEAVCRKALAPAPANRYATALEFRQALLEGARPAESAVALSVPPARNRRQVLVASLGMLALVAALIVWFRPFDPASRRIVAGGAGPLRAEIVVNHYKEVGDGLRVEPLGAVTADSLAKGPPRCNDLIRLRVTLSRSAYCFLIALNPDGKDQLCLREAPAHREELRSVLEYPEDPNDFFGLSDGVGVQGFVVVASDQPLPDYEAWKAQVPGGLKWTTIERDGLWTYDGTAVAATRTSGHVRGKILRREAPPEPLVMLCDRLGRMPGVALVRAVAFPVEPDRGVIK